MPSTRAVGSTQVIALEDGAGPHFQLRTDAFPAASPEHWRQADELDPGAHTAEGTWWLHFRCFALRLADGATILVDAGIGPAEAPAASWAPVPGRLPAELAAAGTDPADVSTVVLTHMHTDHVGWAVVGAPGRPYFRNARYLLQQADREAIEQHSPVLEDRLIGPLLQSGQLRLVEGDTRLGKGIRVVATPGHTPGHQSVVVEGDDANILITGDLLVHAVQLVAPELPYAHEVDPAAAMASRADWLREISERAGPVLATAHLAQPFGYL
jgi:glyoxylase-like metal-dependent hydrolase (beta-lactamase superfamily II)